MQPYHQLSEETVRENLKQAVRRSSHNFASLSKALGKNATYLHQFVHRNTPRYLREEDRRELSLLLGVTEYELGGTFVSSVEDNDPEVLKVRVFDVSASAGPGIFPTHEHAIGTLSLPLSMVPNLTHTNSDMLGCIMVEGDSMYPTLRDGDYVLVDAMQKASLREGIFVICFDNALLVKRILTHPTTGLMTIKSDNPLFDSWENTDPESLSLLGRVIWSFGSR